ncbi:DNA-(apurinic or apyrimidinic site) lyase [Leucoagaricus sp. SymC.cos]|nr:DNA-(apurinic or apyrimidinic site) lyase [Leucoagaricus sp. SymC.cos]
MPPKKQNSLKRQRTEIASDNDSQGSAMKRTRSDLSQQVENPQPTNKVLPVHINFPPRLENTTRISTWNVCGFAASQKKGFKYYVEAEDADILVLTETKVNEQPIDPALNARYPYSYWSISQTKSYSGTAILSKHEPLSVTRTLPNHPDPRSVKGRIITLEFENYYLIGTYTVNAGRDLQTLDKKKEWNEHFEVYIRDLDRKKPVIWTGDLNVAPTEKGMALNLANAKKNWNKSPGYTEAETTSFKNILNPSEGVDGGKFVDVWRRFHPNDQHYTYFSYRFNCRLKGLGWRLDMFVLSERIAGRVKTCEIRDEIYGASDHCPVVMEIEGVF